MGRATQPRTAKANSCMDAVEKFLYDCVGALRVQGPPSKRSVPTDDGRTIHAIEFKLRPAITGAGLVEIGKAIRAGKLVWPDGSTAGTDDVAFGVGVTDDELIEVLMEVSKA